MARRHLLMLIALALLWGASFMFIKVAVRGVPPATLVLGRVGLAALTLAVVVAFSLGGRRALRALRADAIWLVVVGLLNTALPFWLLSWGETRLDSGLASIIQAAVPIFNAVIAFAFFRESRVTGARLLGVAVGFAGVALLVGAQPHGKLLAAFAVVGMALCYAIGGLFATRHLRQTPPIIIALASTTVATLILMPVGIAQAPHELPSWRVLGSIAMLGIPGTAVAYLLFFGLITGAGSGYASLVTYLIPPIALAYGAIFLGERFGAAAFGGLALILAGVALGTGALGVGALRRRLAPHG